MAGVKPVPGPSYIDEFVPFVVPEDQGIERCTAEGIPTHHELLALLIRILRQEPERKPIS